MWQTIACIGLLLSMALLFSGAAGCDRNGTETCFFKSEGDFCSWSHVGHVNFSMASGAWHLELRPGTDTASLTSRTACSTGGQPHCLWFAYANNVSEFSVSVRCNVSDKAELVWVRVTSSSNNSNEGRVPITTNHNFNVIFKAETLSEENRKHGLVRIYNIRYTTNNCTLEPPAASPTSTAATTSSRNSSPPSTSDGVQQTKRTQANTLSTTSSDGQDEPAESSVKLGIIVGVVVGVIILIVVVILLIVLLRRKRRHSSKANNTPKNSGQHRPNTALSTQLSDSCSILRSPGDPQPSAESEIPEYAVVNKQRTKKQENPPQSPYENCDHNAQNLNQNSEHDRSQEQGQDRDGISSTPRNPEPTIASGGSVYQVPRGDTTTKSEDQGEKYNALDFEGQRSVSEKRHAEGTFEDGAGTVYNHLNNGDEDAYNEVDRHTNAQGFSDEYSHIQ